MYALHIWVLEVCYDVLPACVGLKRAINIVMLK